ncbi:kinase-like domain-containing protein [Rhizophagus diaphanus]|nr:kinase-like domain-containing protein [Rhizophagus diaphanus] [Rhizophagus sp. MUCL 43196]
MNQKSFIITFTLFVFFFLIYSEKTYGCHPAGLNGCDKDVCKCDTFSITDANMLSNKSLNITVKSNDGSHSQAFGHFTMSDDAGGKYRFLKNPRFVNDCECKGEGPNTVDPYTSNWPYTIDTPPGGTWFDAWLTVYWKCDFGTLYDVDCCATALHYREYKLSWRDKLYHLLNISCRLQHINDNELIHRDLHVGNIIIDDNIIISDMGLYKPTYYNVSTETENNVYGVLPYTAPEILLGQIYTKAADIYSFGIIMYEVISGLPPYHDLIHDEYFV